MESKFFYINDECGCQQNLTNDSSFSMIKASQIKGSILMKKILKLSILLLGALSVLLGCSSEAKSEFVLQEIASKTKLIYVYDKEKDSVSKLTMEIIYDITKDERYTEAVRSQRNEIVAEMEGIEGVTFTKKDDNNYITLTIEVDVNKFKFDDAASRKKAPTLYNTVNAALKRKDNIVSYQLSKDAILEYDFKEVK